MAKSRTFHQMKQMKKKGYSATDLCLLREIAKKNAERLEVQATEKSFLYMLAIPLNVLVNDYWQKSAKKRAPRFLNEVIKLFDAVQEGVVSDEDLADLLKMYAGMTVEAEWLKTREGKENGKE